MSVKVGQSQQIAGREVFRASGWTETNCRDDVMFEIDGRRRTCKDAGSPKLAFNNYGGICMKVRHLAAGAAMVTMAVGLGSAPALADTPQPSASYGGSLVAGPGATVVTINYTCSSSASPINHLFVAVKQGPDVNASDHTSSQFAETFYSTNWKSDSGPNALNCDGVAHTQDIVLKPQPGFVPSVPRLHSGQALVQICVFDNVTQFSDDGEPLDGGFAPSYTMEQVHAGKGQG
jgi:hypothetical protein